MNKQEINRVVKGIYSQLDTECELVTSQNLGKSHSEIIKRVSYACYHRLAEGIKRNIPINSFINCIETKYGEALKEKIRDVERRNSDVNGFTDTFLRRQIEDLGLNSDSYY